MSNKAYYITAADLAERGPEDIPNEIVCNKNLIFSSPATLSYNAPGAQGFGVKRAGIVIPESVMLLVSPACCGRNTTILGDEGNYSDRMFFLQLDDTDIVTGRYLDDIPKAVKEVYETCDPKPKAVVICITCVDALLGTDLKRVCRKAEKYAGVHVVPSYMYALTREGKNPPMVSIRESIYSLLKPMEKKNDVLNLVGNFAPLEDDCEIYNMLHGIGIRKINEVSRCENFDQYLNMAEANFNLILDPEVRRAAVGMEKDLNIPYAELTRMYQLDKIKKQYTLFGAALGVKFDDSAYYKKAEEAVERFKKKFAGKTFAVGQVVNANSLELAIALVRYGCRMEAVFSNIVPEYFPYIRKLAELSPDTKLYSTLSPSIINYTEDANVDISIGIDASYYYTKSINVKWNNETQPFGYMGLIHFIETVERSC